MPSQAIAQSEGLSMESVPDLGMSIPSTMEKIDHEITPKP